MSAADIIALAAAMFLLAIVPGPGVFAIVSRALSSGLKAAFTLALGIVVGDLVFLLLAIFGLSYVADLLGSLFMIVKLAGGVYLIWLGISLWRNPETKPFEEAKSQSQASMTDFLSGLANTLGNPKVILFYLTFLPTFLDLETLSIKEIALTALVVSSVLGVVLIAYAFAAFRTEAVILNRRRPELIRRAAATILIAIGSILITRSD